jgi:hypothetical protein
MKYSMTEQYNVYSNENNEEYYSSSKWDPEILADLKNIK